MSDSLYTFVDNETGEFADESAPNEEAARLWLGDKWMFADQCPLLASPAAVGDWGALIKRAQGEVDAARAAMMSAQPGTNASMEELVAYQALCDIFDRKAARLSTFNEMSVAAA
jgi:hypothetical protein